MQFGAIDAPGASNAPVALTVPIRVRGNVDVQYEVVRTGVADPTPIVGGTVRLRAGRVFVTVELALPAADPAQPMHYEIRIVGASPSVRAGSSGLLNVIAA